MKSKIFEQNPVNAMRACRAVPSCRRGAGLVRRRAAAGNLIGPALAEDHPAIGTYPAGSSGSSVFIGITVPRTGTYALQGEDELKGYQLAIEHINSGHELIKKISPKTTKGVLGKEVKFGVADSGAKPNEAVQAAAALHHREQGGADDRLDLERGRGGAQQARAAREGALRRRHFRIERHHRQGLRALRLPRSASTARPRRPRSARSSSRPSARARRPPI